MTLKKSTHESGMAMIFLNLFFAFSIHARAQETIIVPGDPNLKIEDRILNLEKAVRDLQKKTYKIPESSPAPTRPPAPYGTKYICEIHMFGQYFIGYGRTKLQAKDEATFKCKSANIEDVHCIKSDCKENK